eukprot:15473981-Alexandrium_andersonii.AAC.1
MPLLLTLRLAVLSLSRFAVCACRVCFSVCVCAAVAIAGDAGVSKVDADTAARSPLSALVLGPCACFSSFCAPSS